MDKETLSHYGWIVILVLILSVLLALASPFGNFIAEGFKAAYAGFFSTGENALGIVIPGTEQDTSPTIKFYQPYQGNINGMNVEFVFHEDGSFDLYLLDMKEGGTLPSGTAEYGEGYINLGDGEGTITEGGKELIFDGGDEDEDIVLTLIPTPIHYIYYGQYYNAEDIDTGEIIFTIRFNEDGSGDSGEGNEFPAGYTEYSDRYFKPAGAEDDQKCAVYPNGTKIIISGMIMEIDCPHINTEIRDETEEYTGDTYCKDCGILIEKGRYKNAPVALILDNSANPNDALPMVFGKLDANLNVGDMYNSTTYGELEILAIYSGFETEEYKSGNALLDRGVQPRWTIVEADTPWFEYAEQVTSVITETYVMPISTSSWFYNFTNCNRFILDKLDMSNVTDTSYMFQYANSVEDLSTLNLGPSIKNMESTFEGCSSLKQSPNLTNATNVENMISIFENCTSLQNVPDLSKNKKVTTLESGFAWCESLTNGGDLTGMDSLSDVSYAFRYCSGLITGAKLPKNVEDLNYTYYSCQNMTTMPDINSDKELLLNYTFYNCKSLAGEFAINADITPFEYKCMVDGQSSEYEPKVKITGHSLYLFWAAEYSQCEIWVTTKPGVTYVDQYSKGEVNGNRDGACNGKNMHLILSDGVEEIRIAAFNWYMAMETAVIPKSVRKIEIDAFQGSGVKDFYYEGTKAEWGCIEKGYLWCGPYKNLSELQYANKSYLCATVHCSDGDILIYPSNLGSSTTGSHNYVEIEGAKWTYSSTYEHQRLAECSICKRQVIQKASHTGGTSSCTERAKCTVCNSYYGSVKSHNYIADANAEWEQYNDSQHKKTATCSGCGATGYVYTSHSYSAKANATWETYTTSQHKKEAVCACGKDGYVYGYHSYTVNSDAEFEYYSTSQHKKAAKCSCGYDGYVYSSHSFVANANAEWEPYTTSQHKKAATCSGCKTAGYVYASHTGGSATCQTKKTCTACGDQYGALGTCSGGRATCQSKAKCSTCGNEYGTIGAHITENGVCTLCGLSATVIETAHYPYAGNTAVRGSIGSWDYTGAKSVNITITYQSESINYDYAQITEGKDYGTDGWYDTRNYLTTSGTIISTTGTASSQTKFGGTTQKTVTFNNVNMITGSVIFTADASVNNYHGVTVTITPNY